MSQDPEVPKEAEPVPKETKPKKSKRLRTKAQIDQYLAERPKSSTWGFTNTSDFDVKVFAGDGAIWEMDNKEREEMTEEEEAHPDHPGRQVFSRRMVIPCEIDVTGVYDNEKTGRTYDVTLTTADGKMMNGTLDKKTLEDNKLLNAWFTGFGIAANLPKNKTWEIKKFILKHEGAQRVVTCPEYSGVLDEYGVTIANGKSFDVNGVASEVVEHGAGARRSFITQQLDCKDGQKRTFQVNRIDSAMFRPTMQYDPENPIATLEDSVAGLHRFSDLLTSSQGNTRGTIALGWSIASIFRDVIIAAENAFPILYLHGHKGSGKDTLARWLQKVSGVGHIGGRNGGEQSTLKGLRNLLSISTWPLWINEIRNDDNCKPLMSNVRSIFDVQGNFRARKEGREIEDFAVRRPLMLSGQDILGYDAEHSRYVLLEFHEKTRDPDPKIRREHKRNVDNAVPDAHNAFFAMVAARPILSKFVMQLVDHWRKAIGERIQCSDRQQFCWAVPLAGLSLLHFEAIIDTIGDGSDVTKSVPSVIFDEVINCIAAAKEIVAADGILGRFWNRLESLHAEKQIPNEGPQRWLQKVLIKNAGKDELCVAIWVNHCLHKIERGSRRDEASARLLLSEMAAHNDCIATSHVVQMVEPQYSTHLGQWTYGKRRGRRCALFRYTADIVPRFVRDELDTALLQNLMGDDAAEKQNVLFSEE